MSGAVNVTVRCQAYPDDRAKHARDPWRVCGMEYVTALESFRARANRCPRCRGYEARQLDEVPPMPDADDGA